MNETNPLEWMVNLKNYNPDILFRGQRKVYPTINPSLFRESADKIDAVRLLTKRLSKYSTGITGYKISNRIHEIGILQHYLEISQMIDLTGTPEVAIFFALLNSKKEEEQVIYAFEKSRLINSHLSVLELDLILKPLANNGLNCRWWRQDGYGVYKNELSNFNILDYPHQEFRFNKTSIEENIAAKIGDLMSVQEDEIANSVYAFLHLITEKYELNKALSKELNNLPVKNPKVTLVEEIYNLRERYKEKGLDVTQFDKFINAVNQNYWNTSWDAGLDKLKNEIKNVD
ncbi:FRG domain-containing protein [Luteirhabdus pelagi]|uniref:FRG domain-containing protein n=1 Tax=Luteirhabdus pelagi TaxID=2792783 RepID=UPI00193A6373|nr:FRG domain-containing protein [Luteirhabdus pelagi]